MYMYIWAWTQQKQKMKTIYSGPTTIQKWIGDGQNFASKYQKVIVNVFVLAPPGPPISMLKTGLLRNARGQPADKSSQVTWQVLSSTLKSGVRGRVVTQCCMSFVMWYIGTHGCIFTCKLLSVTCLDVQYLSYPCVYFVICFLSCGIKGFVFSLVV